MRWIALTCMAVVQLAVAGCTTQTEEAAVTETLVVEAPAEVAVTPIHDDRPAVVKNEILWDTYGVPHIYGTDAESVFYGYGWAQVHSHANTVLRLYGEARGKGAEYWGPEYEETAKWLVMNGTPERAQVWYDAYSPLQKA